MAPDMSYDAPLEVYQTTVLPEWIDYNGHFNVAYYLMTFDHATDALFDLIGIGRDYTEAGLGSAFSLECHLTFQRELAAGDPVRVTFQLLDVDPKRLHYLMRLYHAGEGFLSSTFEQIGLHVDIETRKSAPFPATTYAMLLDILAGHRRLPPPPEAGRTIAIRRKS